MKETTQQTTRQLKVGRIRQERLRRRITSKPIPLLRISGEWFRQAGFEAGSKVEVRVKQGELTLKSLG